MTEELLSKWAARIAGCVLVDQEAARRQGDAWALLPALKDFEREVAREERAACAIVAEKTQGRGLRAKIADEIRRRA